MSGSDRIPSSPLAFQSLLTECGFKRQRYNSTVMSADEMRSAWRTSPARR
ncbi:MAG: hypothetical protein IKN41_00010 [Candidatus Methanomethylophilaceae archaeon]|nr:hypothetical protein [Candidatus Methanomethylophilaceae archaeon]